MMLKNIVLTGLVFLCFVTDILCSNYVVYDLGTLSSEDRFTANQINDQGQILGGYSSYDGKESGFFVWDSKDGFSIEIRERAGAYINNLGEVVGIAYGKKSNNIYTWDKNLGFQYIKIPDGMSNVHIRGFNDQGHILISFQPKGIARMISGLYRNGSWEIIDEYSLIWNLLKEQGENTITSVIVTKINNGTIAGIYGYGKLNVHLNKFIEIGKKPFCWDGNTEAISIPVSVDTHNPSTLIEIIGLNNNGDIYFCCGEEIINDSGRYESVRNMWMWNKKENKALPNNALNNFSTNLCCNTLTDNLMLIVTSITGCQRSYLYYEDELVLLEDLLGITQTSPFSGSYGFDSLDHDQFSINNSGQIVGNGKIWGKSHPFIAIPNRD